MIDPLSATEQEVAIEDIRLKINEIIENVGVNVGESPPSSADAVNGELWYDTATAGLYIWIESINAWLQTNASTADSGGGVFVSTADPVEAGSAGELWFNSTSSTLFIYVDSTSGWVSAVGGGGQTIDSIDDINDVQTTGPNHNPSDGDVLTWDTAMGHWMPKASSASGSGSGPRAYVAFDGTSNDLTASITNSHNVTSITDGGAGTYTINFTNTIENPVITLGGSHNLGNENIYLTSVSSSSCAIKITKDTEGVVLAGRDLDYVAVTIH